LFLTHDIFEYNNHNIGKVENDTFRRNSLHIESDECSPISPLMGLFNRNDYLPVAEAM